MPQVHHVSDAMVADGIDRTMVNDVAAAAFVATADGAAMNLPMVREVQRHANAVFGLKSGAAPALSGVKGGGLWLGTAAIGIADQSEAATRLRPHCPEVAVVSPEAMARSVDVVITMTTAPGPQILVDLVRPGTHSAAMGADTASRQELDTKLVGSASLFVDSRDQSITIGECQHAHVVALLAGRPIEETGREISAAALGRMSVAEVRIFDRSDVAVQNLDPARLAADPMCSVARP